MGYQGKQGNNPQPSFRRPLCFGRQTSISVGRPLCVGRPTRSGSTDLGVGNTKLGKSKKNFGEKGLKQRKEVVDPLGEQHVHGSKPKNSHKNQQETRSWVTLFLVGIFELGKSQKSGSKPSGSTGANNGKHTHKDSGTCATKRKSKVGPNED